MAGSDENGIDEKDADALVRRAGQKQADGHPDEAESLFRDAVRAFEQDAPEESAPLVLALGALGRLLVDRGAFAEAEAFLNRALELSEVAAGEGDDERPMVLRELSRLFILQSAHDRAEAPLVRLLAIAEAQGDSRPEVATVLASLASVRHALGDYASAEPLYRRALGIREKTLAPNHITTAATLESLAETCAARGRFPEAIALCYRAVSMRELTLGAADASVRVARQRIADLQFEAQEESRMTTPPRSTPGVPTLSRVSHPVMERASATAAPPLPAVLVPWNTDLAAVREEIESTSVALVDARVSRRSSLALPVETSSRTTVVVVAAVAVALAAVGYQTQFGSKPAPGTFAEAEPLNPGASAPTPPTASMIVAPPSTDTVVSAPMPRDTPRPQVTPSNLAVVQPRMTESAPTASRTEAVRASRPVRPDSSVARAAVTAEKAPDVRVRSESPNAPTSPTLIGAAPQPQYPDALLDLAVEGDVVVQFVVEESGQADVSSMTVVRSPHALLTNAVRAVLPLLRFEPARTAPPQSIPRPETVRRTFTFHAPRR